MAYTVMAATRYVLRAYKVIAHVGMAHIIMAYTVMAYMGMAHIVVASSRYVLQASQISYYYYDIIIIVS